MDNGEILKLILGELKDLKQGQTKLEQGVAKLDQRVAKLELGQVKLYKHDVEIAVLGNGKLG